MRASTFQGCGWLMLALLAGGGMEAQTVTVEAATQTQVALAIRGASGACTIQVSESPAFEPLHPDVNGTEYAGASTDLGRADTITQSDGTRLVTIGHMNDDRALAAFTTYYWQISGCGAGAGGTFSTANLTTGTTQQWPVPFNSNNSWNFGYPQVNLTNPAVLVDPVSGVKVLPVNAAGDNGWRTGGGPSGPQSGVYNPFLYWAGGSGWTNPGNVLKGATSTASTSNTNPIDLYGVPAGFPSGEPWNGISIDDRAVVPWGSASNTSGSNGQFTVQLLQAGSPVGSPVTITATGSFGQIKSGGSDPDQPFPSNFPTAFFNGWGLTAPLGPDYVDVPGATICVSSVCTIPSAYLTNSGNAYNATQLSGGHFPSTMVSGTKIYIAGSTCSDNGMAGVCSVLSLQNQGQVTIQESYSTPSFTVSSISSASQAVLTLSSTAPSWLAPASGCNAGETGTGCTFIYVSGVTGTGCSAFNGYLAVQAVSGSTVTVNTNGSACSYTANSGTAVPMNNFTALMWGVRLTKATSTGTLTVGAAYKEAGSRATDIQGPGQWNCSSVPFTSGDGHVGYLCSSDIGVQTGAYSMYFVSGDGTSRWIWSMRVPNNSSCFNGASTNDQPTGQGFPVNSSSVSFSTSSGNVMYYVANNQGGELSAFQVTYAGNASTNLPPKGTPYAGDMVGDLPLYVSPCDSTSWVNLTPSASGNDISTQIAAWPTYNAALYGSGSSFNTSPQISGTTLYLTNLYAGQNYAAWIAVIDLSQNPAKLVNMIHTFDGTGTSTDASCVTSIGSCGIRWGGHHNGGAVGAQPNTVALSENPLVNQNTNVLFSGPFVATPIAILESDGVTWNTNTALTWPPNSSTYDTNCPGGYAYAAWAYTLTPGGSPVTNNCVTILFPPGGVCNAYPSTTEKANFPACPWNSSYTQPLSLAVGDNFGDTGCGSTPGSDLGDFGDCEHFRIVQTSTIASGPYAGDLAVVAMRNAIFDYCSYGVYFPGSAINNGAAVESQVTHINGWQAAMLPPRLNGCVSAVFYYQWGASTRSIAEEGRLQQGHGGLYPGSTTGSLSLLTSNSSIPNKSFLQIFSLPTTFYNLAYPTFQGQALSVGGGAVQSYVNAVGGVPWFMDTNAMNGNGGQPPEQFSNTIGSVTLTSVSGSVYTISALGVSLTNANYKQFPLLGWAGRYLLHDVSGPSSNIASSPYGICYTYAAGECYSGSTAGTLYVNVPGALGSGSCNAGQSWLVAPCVIAGFPSGGAVRRQVYTQPDANSRGSQLVTYALTAPGEHYPYSEGLPLADNSAALLAAHETQGWGTVSFLAKLPPLVADTESRFQLAGLQLRLPAGPQYAEVQFGYSRYIGANLSPAGNFFCTSRADGCNTNSVSGAPFAFESETSTPVACGSGCVVTVPVAAPNLVYYRIRRSSDGVNWAAQDVQVVGKP